MTTFFLVRHAAHDLVDHVLVGRMPGVTLGHRGHAQAAGLAQRLCGERITAVQSSPRERARETAAPIAARNGLPIEIVDAVDELDAGEWTGQPFTSLANDPDWTLWNAERATARPPSGESMGELQHRMIRHLCMAHDAAPEGRIAIVTHAEPIRAALLHTLDVPLGDFAQIEVAPASVSTIRMEHGAAAVVAINETGAP